MRLLGRHPGNEQVNSDAPRSNKHPKHRTQMQTSQARAKDGRASEAAKQHRMTNESCPSGSAPHSQACPCQETGRVASRMCSLRGSPQAVDMLGTCVSHTHARRPPGRTENVSSKHRLTQTHTHTAFMHTRTQLAMSRAHLAPVYDKPPSLAASRANKHCASKAKAMLYDGCLKVHGQQMDLNDIARRP